MRFAFGLVAVLIAVGVMVMIMNSELKYDQTVIKAGNKARDEAVQIAGVGARESINMEAENDANGRNTDILVKGLIPGGPMEAYFGLKIGDKIVEIGPQSVRDWGDSEMAEAQVLEMYQRSGQIVVLRNGERLTLPAKPGAAVAAGASSNTANGSSNNSSSANSTPADPLKALQNIPTH